jgi:hypothetical protein
MPRICAWARKPRLFGAFVGRSQKNCGRLFSPGKLLLTHRVGRDEMMQPNGDPFMGFGTLMLDGTRRVRANGGDETEEQASIRRVKGSAGFEAEMREGWQQG